ncbi:hypothetical protein LAZ67_11000116 [Cordylochernes scorpioides]|uniref:Uncharacterized protein n=1 Tax=Cordylochernes scorpioides TaxID=51811 RepID=A0ABY6L0F5_9ARAC|nr:hypothetical protein LAZ67_11000116 [Cordylochernes scorpioides]
MNFRYPPSFTQQRRRICILSNWQVEALTAGLDVNRIEKSFRCEDCYKPTFYNIVYNVPLRKNGLLPSFLSYLHSIISELVVELVDGVCAGDGIKPVELVDGVCWGCVFFLIFTQQSYQGIKPVELVDGVCWGCVFFFLISTQSYQSIKLVELDDGVCWGCVFFLISTQSYQGIRLVELVDELVDGVCWGCVFFFLISTQSYQGIKLVELVDGVCAGDE